MKHVITSIIYYFFVGLFLMLPSHFSQAEDDIVFSTILPENSALFKVAEEMLTEIAHRMDETIKLISVPAKRSTVLLKNNDIHAELIRIEGYEKKVPFAIKVSESLIEVAQYAYSLNQDISINGWKSLKSYHSVALRGTWAIETHMSGNNVTWVDSMGSAFKFLKLGRADILVENSLRVNHFLASTNIDVSGIHRLEPAIYSAKNYTFFAQAYPALALRYEVALRAMKADGSYQAVLSKLDK